MTISQSLRQTLPSTAELPCSDDTPVDNEDQNLLPNLLLFLLASLWSERIDWYFGVDMAVYHTTGLNPRIPVVPDGFLSLGVERRKGGKSGKSRLSYATWEENDVVPILTLEMVSHQPGGEYGKKMNLYAKLGVLYYVIYNPEFWQRDRHQPFEVYKLVNSTYEQQMGESYWMPEVGIGIGRYQGEVGGLPQELLTWYDAQGDRHLSEAEQERQRAEQALEKAERLETFLRSQGINPDQLPEA